MRDGARRAAPTVPAFDFILVVCIGNICRSPTAEFLLKQALPDRRVESAGLSAVVGADMEATARAVAEAGGVPCPRHQARQLTHALCRQADLILVMDTRQREEVAQLCPAARGKTFLLGQGLPETEVVDPYRHSRALFEAVYRQIDAGCRGWARRLAN